MRSLMKGLTWGLRGEAASAHPPPGGTGAGPGAGGFEQGDGGRFGFGPGGVGQDDGGRFGFGQDGFGQDGLGHGGVGQDGFGQGSPGQGSPGQGGAGRSGPGGFGRREPPLSGRIEPSLSRAPQTAAPGVAPPAAAPPAAPAFAASGPAVAVPAASGPAVFDPAAFDPDDTALAAVATPPGLAPWPEAAAPGAAGPHPHGLPWPESRPSRPPDAWLLPRSGSQAAALHGAPPSAGPAALPEQADPSQWHESAAPAVPSWQAPAPVPVPVPGPAAFRSGPHGLPPGFLRPGGAARARPSPWMEESAAPGPEAEALALAGWPAAPLSGIAPGDFCAPRRAAPPPPSPSAPPSPSPSSLPPRRAFADWPPALPVSGPVSGPIPAPEFETEFEAAPGSGIAPGGRATTEERGAPGLAGGASHSPGTGGAAGDGRAAGSLPPGPPAPGSAPESAPESGPGPVPEAPMVETRPVRRDPAPSRLAYRLQRMWLTPLYRLLVRRVLPVFLIVFCLGLALKDPGRRAALVAWGDGLRLAVTERPEFQVSLLRIDGATERTAAEIRRLLDLPLPLSSFDLNLEALQARVAGLDAVASAALHVRKGGVLEVAVSERRPAAVWRSATGIGTIDSAGHPVATLLSRLERPDLPLIVGTGADAAVLEALELMAAAGPLAPRIRGLIRVGGRRWDVVAEPSIRLMLPGDDPVPAFEQVIALHQAQGLLDRDIAAVDLRNPARPTVRMGEAATAAWRAEVALFTGAKSQ